MPIDAKSLLRQTLTRDLYTFANFLAELSEFPPFPEKPVKEMCDWIEDLFRESKGQTYGLELVPRDCHKTTLAAALAILLLVRDPNCRILLSSHTRVHSQSLLMAIKRLLAHPRFIEVFGDWSAGSPRWAEDSIIVSTRTAVRKEGSIEITGVDASRTGSHYDYIVVDDLMNEHNSASEAGRERCLTHLHSLYPILDTTHGVMCLLGTVWHHLDVYMTIIGIEEKRKEAGLPARWRIYRRAAVENGELFYPARLSWEKLEALKAELPARKYSVWYFNEPIEEGMVFFPKARRVLVEATYTLGKYIYPQVHVKTHDGTTTSYPAYVMLLHDPAVSEDEKTANANGIVVVASIPGKKLVVLEAKRAYGPEKTLQFLELFVRKYNPVVYSFEPINAQKLWGRLFRDRMKAAGLRCPRIHEFSGRGTHGLRSKLARIELLQPKYFAGDIWVRRELTDLQDEMDKFPQGLKDLLDALAQAVELCREPDADIVIPGAEDAERPHGTADKKKRLRLPWAGSATTVWVE